jgi:hypothetical protein
VPRPDGYAHVDGAYKTELLEPVTPPHEVITRTHGPGRANQGLDHATSQTPGGRAQSWAGACKLGKVCPQPPRVERMRSTGVWSVRPGLARSRTAQRNGFTAIRPKRVRGYFYSGKFIFFKNAL